MVECANKEKLIRFYGNNGFTCLQEDEYDPYREDFYLALAELYLLHEDKGEAMRILAKCREMLRDEYGVDPGSRYRELLRQIRA